MSDPFFIFDAIPPQSTLAKNYQAGMSKSEAFGRAAPITSLYYGAEDFTTALNQGKFYDAGSIAAGLLVNAVGTVAGGRAGGVGGTANLVEVSAGRLPSAGGVIRQFSQESNQIYYRVYTENREGAFLTAVPPLSSAWAREALALPSQSTATFIQEVLVPAGTRLERSRALPLFGRRGGAEQFELLDQIPKESFSNGVKLP